MTNGQIAQLQELSKCYLPRRKNGFMDEAGFVEVWLSFATENDHMTKPAEALLRRLTHQYRHQIAAMRKNRL